MKFLTSFFVAALCVSTCGIAQTSSGSQLDMEATTSASGSIAVGSMMVTATIPYYMTTATSGSTATGTCDGAKPTKGTRATYEILILRSGNGQVEYSLNLSSIRLEDPEGLTDGISTPALFNVFGREAVRQGVAHGYTPLSSSCSGSIQGVVSAEYYVTRVGSGSNTRFYPSSTQTRVYRGYSACMESGSVSPTVSLVSTTVSNTPTSSNTIQ